MALQFLVGRPPLSNEVHVAHDGEAGLEVAAKARPGVVLLDIGMPKLNGYEAAKRIRSLPGGNDMLLVDLTAPRSGWTVHTQL